MRLNLAGTTILRPPIDDDKQSSQSIWLLIPTAMAQLHSAEPHETPLGACLLSPKSSAVIGWGSRRKVQYTGHQDPDPSPPPDVKPPPPQPAAPAAAKKRSPPARKPKKKGGKKPHEIRPSSGRVDRWSSERYSAAETKLVEIMRRIGAGPGSPIPRNAVREEARKHIGDTGLLDHLLKHMVGEVVADGSDRLRRRHNAEGAMEYWLEPAEYAEIRRKAGVADPFWVPPPGWKVGDATAPCPCGEDCEKEAIKLREEVATVKRDYNSLLQWKSKVEDEMNRMSRCLQALKEEMSLMREEKCKNSKFTGAHHSTILHTAS